jgi:hypothetical protein
MNESEKQTNGGGGWSLRLPVGKVRGVIATLAAIVMLVLGFFGGKYTETIDSINSAQQTADALLASFQETQDASDALQTANAPLPTEIVLPTLEATATPVPPTATVEPTTTCVVPANIAEVVAARGTNDAKTNLFHVLFNNKAGKPVMDIFEDANGNRIQYEHGEHFFVLNEAVSGDGGTIWYVVVGPRGAGYFVRNIHIAFFDLNPTLSC